MIIRPRHRLSKVIHRIIYFDVIEFNGVDWKSVSLSELQTSTTIQDNQFNVDYKPIFSLWFLHLRREERWTSVCYEVSWGVKFGRGETQRSDQRNRDKKERTTFLKQQFLTSLDPRLKWGIMKREIFNNLYQQKFGDTFRSVSNKSRHGKRRDEQAPCMVGGQLSGYQKLISRICQTNLGILI